MGSGQLRIHTYDDNDNDDDDDDDDDELYSCVDVFSWR